MLAPASRAIVCLALLVPTAACSRAAVPATIPAAATVRFALLVPRVAATARVPRFIAATARSAVVAVNGEAATTADLVSTSPACSPVSAGLACTLVIPAPAGNDTFTVRLFDAAGGGGALLGSGATTAAIVPGARNTVGVTIGGAVAAAELHLSGPTPVTGQPATLSLAVTARDADGNAILADPYAAPLLLSTSDRSGTVSLSQTSVAAPGQTLTIAYSGAPLLTATITAGIPGSTIAVTPAYLAPLTASTVDWATYAFDPQRSGRNPAEQSCCAAPPSPLWSIALGASLTAQPLLAANVLDPAVTGGAYRDLLLVADEHGRISALDAATGATVWSRVLGTTTSTCLDIPDGVYGITGTPVFERSTNRVYVVDGTGLLWALDLSTGTLAAGWPAGGLSVVDDPSVDHVYAALTLEPTNRRLYVASASYCDLGTYRGGVRGVDVAAAAVVARFFTGAASVQSGGGIWGFGGLTLDPAGADAFVATGNLFPDETALYSNSVIRLASAGLVPLASAEIALGSDVDSDFGTAPVLFTGPDGTRCAALENKNGTLYLFDRDTLARGPASAIPLGTASTSGLNLGEPAYSPATGLLYLGNATDGALPHGMYAFALAAGCRAGPAPAWSATFGGPGIYTPPMLAAGAVYAGHGSAVAAFDAATGAPLWQTGSEIAGPVLAAPVVANGRIFVASYDGRVHAYASSVLHGATRARNGRMSPAK